MQNVLDVGAIGRAREALDRLFDAYDRLPSGHHKILRNGINRCQGNIDEINHCLRLSSSLKKCDLLLQARKIARVLLGSRSLVSFDHAIYKSAKSGVVDWHQDQAYKASVKYMRSITVWIPLQKTTTNMGCMAYVPLTRIWDMQKHERDPISGAMRTTPPDNKDVIVFEANPGDMIVHTPLTLHSSLPNSSENVRKAWIIHFCPFGRLEPVMPGNLLHLAKYFLAHKSRS